MFALNLTWRHDVFDGKKCEERYGEDNGAEMKTDLQPMCAFPVVTRRNVFVGRKFEQSNYVPLVVPFFATETRNLLSKVSTNDRPWSCPGRLSKSLQGPTNLHRRVPHPLKAMQVLKRLSLSLSLSPYL